MKRKRGSSHVGVIISLLIFIVFMLFLYNIVEPVIKTDANSETLSEYLKLQLLDKFSGDLTSVTLSVEESYAPGEECIEIEHLNETEGLNTIVTDENGTIINSNSTQDYIKIEWGNKTFFKVYYSDEVFGSYPLGAVTCAQPTKDTDYSIGLVKTEKQIYAAKIEGFKSEYDSNYSAIKDELNLKSDANFGFEFEYSNGTILNTGNQSVTRSIYIDEIPIQYIDKDGETLSGKIRIKIW